MIIINGTWTVYYHINKTNGKIYVGITSKEKPEERWRNGKGYYDTPHFKYAIKKYGWDNFEHVVFAKELTEDEACNMEKLLIRELQTTNPLYGYNIAYGGNRGCRFKGKNAPMYGKYHTEETKRKISKSKKGKTITVPEGHGAKISKLMQGNTNGKRTVVFCVEADMCFSSAKEASGVLECDASSILKCAYGKAKSVHGLHFELYNA